MNNVEYNAHDCKGISEVILSRRASSYTAHALYCYVIVTTNVWNSGNPAAQEDPEL